MSNSNEKLAANSAQALPKSFEQAFAELETIVSQMESGKMPLEASLEAFTRGNFLLQFCQKSLAEVEQQVQILNERNQLVTFNSQNTTKQDAE